MTAGYPGDTGRPGSADGPPILPPPAPRMTWATPAAVPVVMSWRSAFRIGVAVWVALLAFAVVVVLACAVAASVVADQAADAAGCDPVNDVGQQVYCP